MSKIFLTSEEHKQRFVDIMQRLGKYNKEEGFYQEYGATLYILTSSYSTWEKTRDYISQDGIDFETMLKEVDFSHAYSLLIDIASSLFNGNERVNLNRLQHLDKENFKIAHMAMWIFYYGLHLRDLD